MSYADGLGVESFYIPSWEMRSGVAIPLTPTMLAYFQSIQRAANGINAKQGRPLIGVDGRIGAKTVEALAQITFKNSTDPWMSVGINAEFIAKNAPEIVGELMDLMKRIGATFVPDPKTSSAPSALKPDGTIANPPDGPSTTMLVIGAIAIGAVVALVAKKRKR